MAPNNSPDWDRLRREWTPPEPPQSVPTTHSAQPEPYADLFAALDRADVSESVRAALAHALNPPPPAGLPDEPDDSRGNLARATTAPPTCASAPSVTPPSPAAATPCT